MLPKMNSLTWLLLFTKLTITGYSKQDMFHNQMYFCSKTERDLQKFSEEEKKMTGFQQKAWLSNDKKERNKVQWDKIIFEKVFLFSCFLIFKQISWYKGNKNQNYEAPVLLES